MVNAPVVGHVTIVGHNILKLKIKPFVVIR